MADVKFPNIAQSNHNSFVESKPIRNNGGNLSEYGDVSAVRNAHDVRSNSFHSGRKGTGNAGISIMNAKKQRKE